VGQIQNATRVSFALPVTTTQHVANKHVLLVFDEAVRRFRQVERGEMRGDAIAFGVEGVAFDRRRRLRRGIRLLDPSNCRCPFLLRPTCPQFLA
jgi:hypothetical protein